MFIQLAHFIGHDSGSVFLLSLTIALCAILFEDLTTIIIGILAAEGMVSVPLALCALYSGIVVSDIALYSFGVIARTHPRLARFSEHRHSTRFRTWLESRYSALIFSAHFVPGLRFTTYVASGFYGRPLRSFVPIAVAGGVVLGTLLFTLSYWFGSVTATWVRPVRWGIALLFIALLFLLGRRSLTTFRET